MANEITASADPIARWAERQDWVRSEIEETAQGFVQAGFELLGPAGEPVRGFLQGDWLHEPLHAAVTDVPVGAWTATTAFDSLAAMTGREEFDFAADAALWVGLAGAAFSALAGLADWSRIDRPKPRRIGAVHALLNISATAVYTASCFARKQAGSRSTGRVLAAAGLAVVALSAHLGGNLVYEHGIGVRSDSSSEPEPGTEVGGTGI